MCSVWGGDETCQSLCARLMGGWSGVGMGGGAQRRSRWESNEPRCGGALENLEQSGQAGANMAVNPMPVCLASLRENKDRYSERKPGLFHYR